MPDSKPLQLFSHDWYRHYYSKAVLDREDARRALAAAREKNEPPEVVTWFQERYAAAQQECEAWEAKVTELEAKPSSK